MGSIWPKWYLYLTQWVIFGHNRLNLAKMSTILAKCIWVVFGKRGFVWPNRLYLAKSVLFGKSGLYLAKVGCIWPKWVVFGQNAWVVFFQNWCYLAKMCCISSQQVVFGHNGLPLGIRPNIS